MLISKQISGLCELFSSKRVYSALYDLFQLSLWSSEEKRPVKVNIHTMYDIGISDNK